VDVVDHNLGIVTTRAVSLTRNVPSAIEDLCLPFGLEAGPLDETSYSLKIIVRAEGSDSSTVEITPRFRFLLSDTPDRWHDCPVEGPLEREMAHSIEENTRLENRNRFE
jgi:hypothetical protein